jgi:FdhE protein
MSFTFDQRVDRAAELAKSQPAATELLDLYTQLVRFQKRVFEDVSVRAETDMGVLTPHFRGLLDLIPYIDPRLLTTELLAAFWEGAPIENEAERLLARSLLQPYAEYLATRGQIDPQWSQSTCPFCSSNPVVAVLRGEGDGGKRSLICSLCSIEWQYRRIVCPSCGEENKDKLPVYVASQFEYVRVEACDNCKTYIKAIDLTKNGHAVPVVDEVATVPLNIWAEENGYLKIESNLLGM